MSPSTPPPTVHGTNLSPTTQCAHWHSPLDIIAIKHFCCKKFYACVSCHDEGERHGSVPWPSSVWGRKGKYARIGREAGGEGDEQEGHRGEDEENEGQEEYEVEEEVEGVVLCGKCKHSMGVGEYLGCESRCPKCAAAFNPGCKNHWNLYFEVDQKDGNDATKSQLGS